MNEHAQRTIPMTLVHWPDTVELCGYCHAQMMTPELVERFVQEVESIIKEPLRHAVRDIFPEPLEGSLRKELERGWNSPKRLATLCNAATRRNHIRIATGRFVGPFADNHAADWARFSLRVAADAPVAPQLAGLLRPFAWLAGAFFMRADSPAWTGSWAKAKGLPALQDTRLRIPSGYGWAITERLGWLNWLGPHAAKALGFDAPAEAAGVALIERNEDGSAVVQLTRAPLDFRDAAYARQYLALQERLAPQRFVPGSFAKKA
ncbi:MAG: hypothetical protein JSS44_09940 [Proteobacteria bacterium]|nr:hypothetical protein [Pseudomonadota bacterium]MBS0462351.1 hypothetical protein [Pseudomonadota bacterium]